MNHQDLQGLKAVFFAYLRFAYDRICRRLSEVEFKNRKKILLRANKEFKEAQDALLEVVIGIERTLVDDKELIKKGELRRFLECYRNVAKRMSDCLAWAIYNFDRLTIKSMSKHPDSGYIYGKKGVAGEQKILERLNSDPNKFALLNDLTSCLRVGDTSVIDTTLWKLTNLEIKSSSTLEMVVNHEVQLTELTDSRLNELSRFFRQYAKMKMYIVI